LRPLRDQRVDDKVLLHVCEAGLSVCEHV
jgi:hypothetical protein